MKRRVESSHRSRFAVSLACLLDETDLFDRAGWATLLRIKPPAISQWLHDRTIPRPDILHMIWKTLEISSGVNEEHLHSFKTMAMRPAEEVSPLGMRMRPTVWEYMTSANAVMIAGSLRGMTHREQQAFAEEGSYLAPLEQPAPTASEIGRVVWVKVRPPAVPIAPTLLPRLYPLSDEQETRPSVDWRELEDVPRVCIFGVPGAGKTALLIHLFEWYTRRAGVPALLLRPVMADQSSDLRDDEQLVNLDVSKFDAEIVMFDALDELPADMRGRATAEIASLEKRQPRMRLVATSRPSDVVMRDLAHFSAYSVAPLTPQQVALWVHQALSAQDVIRAEFNEYFVRLLEREKLQHAFTRPLFLVLALLLFKRHKTTPFADAELVIEYVDFVLGDWERSKNVLRTREPWASPRNLSQLLSGLLYHLARREQRSFKASDFEEWVCDPTVHNVSTTALLEVLSERSGVIRCRPDGLWEASDDYLVDYLAAHHLVNSTENTIRVLFDWGNEDRRREVTRLACSLTTDATAIVRLVLSEEQLSEAERVLMLATVLAQPIRADEEILAGACNRIMQWLDPMLEPWELTRPEPDDVNRSEHLWTLKAVSSKFTEEAEQGWRVLPAIHQARSGPAGELLTERLVRAGSPVLRAVKESLDVDGKLVLLPERDYSTVLAHVFAP